MRVEEEIRSEESKLLALCKRLGVTGLRARVDSDCWTDVIFVGDIDASRLEGYADRFFDLEEGLAAIYHRRVRLIDEEAAKKQALRSVAPVASRPQDIELLHAS